MWFFQYKILNQITAGHTQFVPTIYTPEAVLREGEKPSEVWPYPHCPPMTFLVSVTGQLG